MGTGASRAEHSEHSGKVKELFQKYDVNKDGCISEEELWVVLKQLCPSLTRDEVDRLFARMDSNKDRRIQSNEFVDFIFGFSDITDRAEQELRESASAATAPATSRPSEAESRPREPDLRLLKTDTSLSSFSLSLEGAEPDLPELLQQLRLMDAQALRKVFQRADVSKRGFLKLNDIRRILFPSNVQSDDQQLAVVKVFAQMDKNSDGKVHCGEFVSYLLEGKRRISRTATASEKRQMAVAFSAADADADGRITMDEFETLFGAASSYDREMLRSVFEKVDRNQDGAVSMLELAEVYGKELVQDAKGISVEGSMDAGDDSCED